MRFPNLFTFLKAVGKFFRRPHLVPEDVKLIRSARCEVCPHNEYMQCQKCTCYIPLKVMLATESCPIGHWNEYYSPFHQALLSRRPPS